MKKIYLAALIALLSLADVKAQQDPHYTQYMYNMNVINPAYAGSKENLSFGLLYRKQWVNVDGARRRSRSRDRHLWARTWVSDFRLSPIRIGPVNEQNAYADFSYTLNLGGELKFRTRTQGRGNLPEDRAFQRHQRRHASAGR
ncbi:type IX secretion system membrane protein PorP/SprF [Flavobacterium sp. 3HN19-14]|uniref:type IX secretion system membrane protein PorP/SprF n=1 Tax=Flavobacterium sp. 3HN19-14 TaxID=3448133 RepID=UPI003EE39679